MKGISDPLALLNTILPIQDDIEVRFDRMTYEGKSWIVLMFRRSGSDPTKI